MIYLDINVCPKCGKTETQKTSILASPPEPGTKTTNHADLCIWCHVKTLSPEQAARMWKSMGE